MGAVDEGGVEGVGVGGYGERDGGEDEELGQKVTNGDSLRCYMRCFGVIMPW